MTSQNTHFHRHSEGRSPVRVSEQVDTVSGSQGPHALRAQDDVSCFRHPEAHPHSRHPEERSDVRVSGRQGDDEKGRSMVETLGVLAIMAVLSVAMIAGFHIAVDKSKANTIVQDSRMAFMSAQNHHYEPNGPWEQVEFTPNSGKPTYLRSDWVNRIYVLVEGVEEGVCKQLLRMRTKDVLNFYDDKTNEELTTCVDTVEGNDIVIDWNGVAPAECLTVADCGTSFAGVCNAQHQCQLCDDLEEPNADRTACLCDGGLAVSCTVGEDHWCCGESENGIGQICGPSIDEPCIESEGDCVYEFSLKENEAEYYADCNYTVSENVNKPDMVYYSDCAYTVGDLSGGLGAVTALKSCEDATHYCALFWKGDVSSNGKWDALEGVAHGSGTGTFVGHCQSGSTFTYEGKSLSNPFYRSVTIGKPCANSNQYCALFWKDGVGAEDGRQNDLTLFRHYDTGVIWGQCQDGSMHQFSLNTNKGHYIQQKGCPAQEYCYLGWKPKNGCVVWAAREGGEIHGVCVKGNETGSCPYGE